ncbi:hypothetical protein CEXT_61391 [Caerostris extrusa]|uniref:Prolactin receptor n=1 Tax=Caerostris extrusa TaxID=172846 RepID=A0AAV4RNH6_CAEEX|nr:hypothetical protein CEXT_61391 [Caerostris extrusa]
MLHGQRLRCYNNQNIIFPDPNAGSDTFDSVKRAAFPADEEGFEKRNNKHVAKSQTKSSPEKTSVLTENNFAALNEEKKMLVEETASKMLHRWPLPMNTSVEEIEDSLDEMGFKIDKKSLPGEKQKEGNPSLTDCAIMK